MGARRAGGTSGATGYYPRRGARLFVVEAPLSRGSGVTTTRKVSVVTVTKKLGSNGGHPPHFGPPSGHRDANGRRLRVRGCVRKGERRTARRATIHLANRAFVDQNEPSGI
jgi:hypothetical protein